MQSATPPPRCAHHVVQQHVQRYLGAAPRGRRLPPGESGVDDPLSRALKPCDLGARRRHRCSASDDDDPGGHGGPWALRNRDRQSFAGSVDASCPRKCAARQDRDAPRSRARDPRESAGPQQGQGPALPPGCARAPPNVVISLASRRANSAARGTGRRGRSLVIAFARRSSSLCDRRGTRDCIQRAAERQRQQFFVPVARSSSPTPRCRRNRLPPTPRKEPGRCRIDLVAHDLHFATVYDVADTGS